MDSCIRDLEAQARHLDSERDSARPRFEDYRVPVVSGTAPAPLDPNSSPSAREFRTRIRQEVATEGINFGGRYTLVAVGMTGWGGNRWIVDRRSGRAHEFPYHATALEFRKDSRLIVMNPADSIRELLSVPDGGCYYLNQQKVSDLRPFFFEWRNDSLSLLAPRNIEPPVNTFWVDYMSELPEATPSSLGRFIRAIRTGVIGALRRVPHEGYSGFMMIAAFPAFVPEDFSGITASGGHYDVAGGRLQFTGNASLDAPAIGAEQMGVLLGNVARRLGMPAATDDDVDRVLVELRATDSAQSSSPNGCCAH